MEALIGQAIESVRPTPNLARVLTGDLMASLLENPDDVRELLQLLPEARQSEEELHRTIRSPQLRQALVVLSRALDSDNFYQVMHMLNLSSTSANVVQFLQRGDGVGAFLAALEEYMNQQQQQQQ